MGTVRDTAGRPIAGACVDAHTNSSPWLYLDHVCTDSAGRYEMDNVLADFGYRLEVSAVGYATRWWPSAVDFGDARAVVGGGPGSSTTADIVLPSPAEASGRVAGTVRRQDGTPAVDVRVRVQTPDNVAVAVAYTGTDGSYALTGLVSGQYIVSMFGDGYPQQFVPGKTKVAEAQPQTVVTGQTTTVDETFLPLPTIPSSTLHGISGTVRNPAGAGVAGATVEVWPPATWGMAPLARAVTDQAGHYTVPGLFHLVGTFYLRTTAPGYVATWGANGVMPSTIQTGTADVVKDVVLRSGGAVTGTVRDFDGSAPPLTQLSFTSLDGSVSFSTYAWIDGHIEVPNVPSGTYKITMTHSDRPAEYWPGTVDPDRQTTITVTDGAVTNLDGILAAPARIEATVLDDATGQPISGACVRPPSGEWSDCAPATAPGVYTFDSFTSDQSYSYVVATLAPYYFSGQSGPIAAARGQTTKITIRLRPGALLAFDVTVPADAAAPTVVCFVSDAGVPFATRGSDAGCGAVTAGRVLLGPIEPGQAQVFLLSPGGSSGLGALWMTTVGGGGDQREAVRFTFTAGQTTTGPVQHFLYSGSVRGTVSGPGAGTETVCPGGPSDGGYSCAIGSYTRSHLGPYRWPVSVFLSSSRTIVGWSGAGTNRYNAGYVQVVSGQTAEADIRLRPVSEMVVTAVGVPVNTWTLTAFDPVTGDRVSATGAGSPLQLTGEAVLRFSSPSMAQPCYVSIPQPALPGRRSQPSYVIDPVAQLTITPGVNCRPDIMPSLQPGSGTRR